MGPDPTQIAAGQHNCKCLLGYHRQCAPPPSLPSRISFKASDSVQPDEPQSQLHRQLFDPQAAQRKPYANDQGLFDSNYISPRAVQMNLGIQHEIRHGMVFSADLLRNVETHALLGVDLNHAGDVSNFNLANAQAAISATETGFGHPGDLQATINAGAKLADFVGNGMGSSP